MKPPPLYYRKEGNQMKTILELSRELGVSKVAIMKKIQKLGIKNELAKDGNLFLVDEEQEQTIKPRSGTDQTGKTTTTGKKGTD